VIAKEDAISDLLNWNTFALAGRTQKPVLNFIADKEMEKAI
jgi:Phosphatidate cytidylyltransferase, mitochondrial